MIRRSGLPRRVVCAVALLLSMEAASAIEVRVAPIVFLDDSRGGLAPPPAVERSLCERLSRRFFEGRVTFQSSGNEAAPRSLLEALRLADSRGYPYLVYGYMRRTDETLALELKLADRAARTIAAIFFSGDSSDRYERLVDDMDAKIASYFEESLGLARSGETTVRGRTWSIPVAVGWWGPGTSPWSGALSGLVHAEIGVLLRPRMRERGKGLKARRLGAGTDLEYSLGTSVPGVEEAMLHGVAWRFYADWEADLGEFGRLGASAGPFLRADILAQSRKYQGPYVDAAAVLGVGGRVRYAWRLSGRASMGLCLGVDLAFYAEPLLVLSTALRTEFRVLSKEEGGQ